MYNDVTGIILSGGKSSRMGENKSIMKIGNRNVIEYVTDLMKSLFNKVILITNDPDDYKFLDLEMYADIFLRMGPLAGIHSGLNNSKTIKNFIISCDIPLMKAAMIKYLTEFKTDKPITIAKADGFIQQLCGVYDKKCLPAAEEILSSQNETSTMHNGSKKIRCKVLDLIDKIGAEIIDAESLPFYEKDIYFNMNRKSDFKIVLQKLTIHI